MENEKTSDETDVRIIQSTPNSDVETIHLKFAEYGANAKEWMKKCVLLLLEIDKRRIWAAKGFSSIYEYAAKLSGMNKAKVNNSLRILEVIDDKPALRKVVEKKGLNAVKPIITIVTFETQDFWAEKAMQLTKNELETYVRDFRSGRVVSTMTTATSGENLTVLQISRCSRTSESANLFWEKLTNDLSAKNDETVSARSNDVSEIAQAVPTIPLKKILMELSPEIVSKLEKLKGDGDWETLMQEFLNLRDEKNEAEKPEAREATSRHIPAEIKRFVLEKYNGRCAFPHCNKPYSELHHTERFFFENKHDPDTIIPLCGAHHSLTHKGLVEEKNANSDVNEAYASSEVNPDPNNWRGRETPRLDLVDRMVLAHKR